MALYCCSDSNRGPFDGFVEGANKVAQGIAIYNPSIFRGHFVGRGWQSYLYLSQACSVHLRSPRHMSTALISELQKDHPEILWMRCIGTNPCTPPGPGVDLQPESRRLLDKCPDQ